MKLISSIVILLMLSMVVVPCADSAEIDRSQETEEVVDVNELDESLAFGEEVHHLEDKCPPICPCQCCPSTCSDMVELLQHSETIPLLLTSDYKQPLSSPFLRLVWSPPRLIS